MSHFRHSLIVAFFALLLISGQSKPATAQSLPSGADIIINNVNPAAGNAREISGVELYDGGVGASDLSGLLLVFFQNTNNIISEAFDLDGLRTDENGYFTLDIAISLTQANAVGLYAAPIENFTVGTEIESEASASVIETVRYGFDETDNRGGLISQVTRNPALAEIVAAAAPAVAHAAAPADFGQCGDPATPINEVQGDGDSSPLFGKTVTLEAVVVGDFQDRQKQLRGYFLQENTDETDSDSATSEGIFIFDGGQGSAVNAGDQVRLQGKVDEWNGLTRLKTLKFVEVCASDQQIAPTVITLPMTKVGELEQYEGMLVRLGTEMTVAQNYFLGRYGQLTLATGGRPYQPTHLFAPDSQEAKSLAERNARSLIVLDDGQEIRELGENPNPVPYLGAPPPAVIRAGDTVTNLVGLLDQGRINSAPRPDIGIGYRLQPIEAPIFTNLNQRSATPPVVAGTLRIASANVLNYFNGDGLGGGFPTERGAASQQEFDRQRAKTIAEITALNADIVGLMEIENDGYGAASALQDLVNGLNGAATVSPTYAFINSTASAGNDRLGDDAIKVGLLYQPGKVKPIGSAVTLATGAFDQTLPDGKSRQPLAQTFAMTDGVRITVVVLHLKSKRPGLTAAPEDSDNGNGSGSWNGRRTQAAQQVVEWLASDPTASGSKNVLIIGDLNAYAAETPISTIEAAGYTNLLKKFNGNEAYSFIFDGQSGYLDHALASSALVTQVVAASDWHINTDEPQVLDYGLQFNPPGYYTPEAYRASDHDPVLIGLSLTAVVSGTEEGGDDSDDGDFKPFTCAYHYIVRPGDTLFAIAFRNGVSLYSLVTLNKISNPRLIFVGQSLCIPSSIVVPTPQVETYIVQPGDTLYAIAIRFGVSASAIMRANGIGNPNFIWVGQVLRIPR